MTNEILIEIACPNCLNPIDVREHGQHVVCDACNAKFLLTGHLCPNCHSYHDKNVSICGDCGTALNRLCRKCHTKNWAGDEYCIDCGTAMDILDLAAINYKTATIDRLQQQQQTSRRLKEEGAASSERRLAEMREKENRRLTNLAEQHKQKSQQELLYFLVALVLVLVVLGAIAYFSFGGR